MSKDSLVCPRCGLLFGEGDVREFPNLFWTCPLCGVIQHKACRGPLSDNEELTRLRGIEAAVIGELPSSREPANVKNKIEWLRDYAKHPEVFSASLGALAWGLADALEKK